MMSQIITFAKTKIENGTLKKSIIHPILYGMIGARISISTASD